MFWCYWRSLLLLLLICVRQVAITWYDCNGNGTGHSWRARRTRYADLELLNRRERDLTRLLTQDAGSILGITIRLAVCKRTPRPFRFLLKLYLTPRARCLCGPQRPLTYRPFCLALAIIFFFLFSYFR